MILSVIGSNIYLNDTKQNFKAIFLLDLYYNGLVSTFTDKEDVLLFILMLDLAQNYNTIFNRDEETNFWPFDLDFYYYNCKLLNYKIHYHFFNRLLEF